MDDFLYWATLSRAELGGFHFVLALSNVDMNVPKEELFVVINTSTHVRDPFPVNRHSTPVSEREHSLQIP